MNMRSIRRVLCIVACAAMLLASLVPCASALSVAVKTVGSAKIYSKTSNGTSSARIGKGVSMTVQQVNNGWAKVKKNGRTAYIRTTSLKPAESSKIKNIISYALLQLGKRYGKGSNAFNCSSLVRHVFRQYGISTKGTAKAICADNRLSLVSSVSSIQAGDILCFDTSGNGVCDHVAIAINKNTFVEASQGAGKVRVNKLNTWYRKHFICARRA